MVGMREGEDRMRFNSKSFKIEQSIDVTAKMLCLDYCFLCFLVTKKKKSVWNGTVNMST